MRIRYSSLAHASLLLVVLAWTGCAQAAVTGSVKGSISTLQGENIAYAGTAHLYLCQASNDVVCTGSTSAAAAVDDSGNYLIILDSADVVPGKYQVTLGRSATPVGASPPSSTKPVFAFVNLVNGNNSITQNFQLPPSEIQIYPSNTCGVFIPKKGSCTVDVTLKNTTSTQIEFDWWAEVQTYSDSGEDSYITGKNGKNSRYHTTLAAGELVTLPIVVSTYKMEVGSQIHVKFTASSTDTPSSILGLGIFGINTTQLKMNTELTFTVGGTDSSGLTPVVSYSDGLLKLEVRNDTDTDLGHFVANFHISSGIVVVGGSTGSTCPVSSFGYPDVEIEFFSLYKGASCGIFMTIAHGSSLQSVTVDKGDIYLDSGKKNKEKYSYSFVP